MFKVKKEKIFFYVMLTLGLIIIPLVSFVFFSASNVFYEYEILNLFNRHEVINNFNKLKEEDYLSKYLYDLKIISIVWFIGICLPLSYLFVEKDKKHSLLNKLRILGLIPLFSFIHFMLYPPRIEHFVGEFEVVFCDVGMQRNLYFHQISIEHLLEKNSILFVLFVFVLLIFSKKIKKLISQKTH